ncbi:MAG TPA: hypothetical protein VMU93_08745 [Caulobacteraceae bacterium]|nr:hypothetical protein [Caulobacteraceae bacterium]
MRRFLIVMIALGLSACQVVRAPLAFIWRHHHGKPAMAAASAPRPAEGLWAILDPGCPKPSQADIHAWPSCASPFWLNRGKALVVREASGRTSAMLDASYAANYHLDPGDPLIAEVGTPKDGYLFLALTDLTENGRGQLVGATGAAVACPGPASSAISIKPSSSGCGVQPLAAVRKAAVLALQDRTALNEVAFIAPGAPSL